MSDKTSKSTVQINAEWVINKAKEKIYAVSHSKSMFRKGSNVDASILSIENAYYEETKYLKDNKEKTDSFVKHLEDTVQGEGVHGFRFYNGELQYHNGEDWMVIDTGVEGFPPGNMKSVQVSEGISEGELVLKGADPDNTFLDGKLITTWKGTKIVRKVGGYPSNPSDGVLVVDYQVRNQYASEGFLDTGLVTGETYYYRWFPYSDTGVVNMSEDTAKNMAIGIPKPTVVLGVTIDFTNRTYTRTDDASELSAGSKFDNFRMYQRRRCIVADDQTILAYFGDSAYTETGKLTKSVTKDGKTYPVGTNVQVMVYQPKFYYKVTPITKEKMNDSYASYLVRKVKYQVAEKPIPGFTTHPAFVRHEEELPYILLSAYEACAQDSNGNYIKDNSAVGVKLASISGAKPTTSGIGTAGRNGVFTRAIARGLAYNRGTGWQISDILTISATQLLFMIEYATMNAQSAIGMGVSRNEPSYNGVVASGATSNLGDTSGRDTSKEDGYGAVTYRGEENLWGNTFCFVDGANFDNLGRNYLYYASEGYEDNTKTGNYIRSCVGTTRNEGYSSAIGWSEYCDWSLLPAEVNGDSSSPIGDYAVLNPKADTMTIALLGGRTDDDLKCGLFYWILDRDSDESGWDKGARLVCLPTYSLVTDQTPGDMKAINVLQGKDETQLLITGTDPDDTMAGSTTLVKWKGTMIVRREGTFPSSPSDGTVIVDYQERNKYAKNGFVDTGLSEGVTYFYRWFPYSDKGIINKSDSSRNKKAGVPKKKQIISVHIKFNSSSNKWEVKKTNLSKGLNAGADFDQFTMYGGRRRCIVADDRTILAFYGDSAYTETGKLTKQVSKNGITYPIGTNAQVMVYQPKFWYKIEPINPKENVWGTGYQYNEATLSVSEAPYEDFKVHPAFIHKNKEYSYILLAAYEASTQDSSGNYNYNGDTSSAKSDKLSSISGTIPQDCIYMDYFRSYANKRGAGWQIQDMTALSCTQLLFIIEYGSLDCQGSIGKGNVMTSRDSDGYIRSGATSNLGNSSGRDTSKEDGYGAVTYRGEENLWGNSWSFIEGMSAYNSGEGILYWADHGYLNKPSTSEPYTSTGFNFSRSAGYPKAFGYSPECDWMFVPTEVISMSDTSDYFKPKYTSSDPTVVRYGCGGSLASGLFSLNLEDTVNTYSATWGARLMCLPDEGSEPAVLIDISSANFTRLGTAKGLNPGQDFNVFKMYRDRRRCIVADDRTILAFYGDEAYTETGKLTKQVTKDGKTYPVGTNVQVMVYQPKFYYNLTPYDATDTSSGGKYYTKAQLALSDVPVDGFKIHPAFVRDGKEYPYVLMAAFEAGVELEDGSYHQDGTYDYPGIKLASVGNLYPARSSERSIDYPMRLTIDMARQRVYRRGTGWQLYDALMLSATQMLFLVEYATFDAQAAIGKGNSGLDSTISVTGKTSSLGNTSGRDSSKGDGFSSVTYRGEENLWGNVAYGLEGLQTYPFSVGKVYWADHGFESNKMAYPYKYAGYCYSGESGFFTRFCYSEYCDFLFIPSIAAYGDDVDNYNKLPKGAADYFYSFRNNKENSDMNMFSAGGAVGDKTDVTISSEVAEIREKRIGLFNLVDNPLTVLDDEGNSINAGAAFLSWRIACIPPEGAAEE